MLRSMLSCGARRSATVSTPMTGGSMIGCSAQVLDLDNTRMCREVGTLQHIFIGNTFPIFYRMLIVCCGSDSDFLIRWSDEFWEALQKQQVLASCSKNPPWVWREGGADDKEKLKALLWQASVWQRSKHQRDVTLTYCSHSVALFWMSNYLRSRK